METIHHQSHHHELTLQEDNFYHYCHGYCSGCFETIANGSPAYVCETCRFGLHKSCSELPTEISHPLHPQHPLTFLSHPYPPLVCFRCRDLYCSFGFSCSACSFNLDLKCAWSKDDTLSQQEVLERDIKATFKHFCYKHELKLCNLLGRCLSCHCCEYCISDSAYYCRDCEFLIHESCLEIPQCVEQHPEHPLRFCDVNEDFKERYKPCDACGYLIHGFSLMCGSCECFFHVTCVKAIGRPLNHNCHSHNMFYFKDVNAETWLCDRCKHYLSGSYYGCVICGIRLHLQCVPIPKIVEHKCHLHPLELVDSVVEDDYSRVNNCDVCETPRDAKNSFYKCKKCGCVICGIRLHLQCVPIPKIVEHKCHLHPLELVDSVVEDDYSRVNNCDVCETPRDAKNSFYKCKKCGFVAHIECIVSEDDTSLEILSSLNRGFEDKAEQCNDEN